MSNRKIDLKTKKAAVDLIRKIVQNADLDIVYLVLVDDDQHYKGLNFSSDTMLKLDSDSGSLSVQPIGVDESVDSAALRVQRTTLAIHQFAEFGINTSEEMCNIVSSLQSITPMSPTDIN